MSDAEASRRTVLKGSAIGAGALLTASGLAATARAAGAATPKATNADGAQPAQGEDSYFLKLDGIAGESLVKGYEDWIEITDFSVGASRGALNGTSTGKQPKEMEVHFEAPLSKASPLLLLSAFDGKAVKTGNITVTDTQLHPFLKIDLTDIVVSSFQTGGIEEDRPTDSASLSFGKIKFSYFPQNADGALEKPIIAVWDLRAEKV
ncbi:MAG TPA: type VI secretion system tube protein Hcp [Jatrophihabitantaceae bacterium]|jgi:type VI protein secretion system component Hcp